MIWSIKIVTKTFKSFLWYFVAYAYNNETRKNTILLIIITLKEFVDLIKVFHFQRKIFILLHWLRFFIYTLFETLFETSISCSFLHELHAHHHNLDIVTPYFTSNDTYMYLHAHETYIVSIIPQTVWYFFIWNSVR